MYVLLAVLSSEGDPHIYLTVPLYDYQVSFDLCDSKEWKGGLFNRKYDSAYFALDFQM